MERISVQSPAVAPFRLVDDDRSVPGAPAVLLRQPGSWIFVSGQTALGADGSLVGPGDPAAQARQCLENLKGILEAAGASLRDVVKLMAWVTDAAYVGPYVEVRGEYFSEPFPASTTVVGRLVREDLLIEIEAVAAY